MPPEYLLHVPDLSNGSAQAGIHPYLSHMLNSACRTQTGNFLCIFFLSPCAISIEYQRILRYSRYALEPPKANSLGRLSVLFAQCLRGREGEKMPCLSSSERWGVWGYPALTLTHRWKSCQHSLQVYDVMSCWPSSPRQLFFHVAHTFPLLIHELWTVRILPHFKTSVPFSAFPPAMCCTL